MKKGHIGSNFDDFLAEEGILAECEAVARERARTVTGPPAAPDFLARAKAVWGEKPSGKSLSAIVSEAR